jgi:hypothetical protein
MRLISVKFRGEDVDVQASSSGYEPDTNSEEIEWYIEGLTDEGVKALGITSEEEDEIIVQLSKFFNDPHEGYFDD